MTLDELQRRIDALCAESGEPDGTVVVSVREDGCGKWVAFTRWHDETVDEAVSDARDRVEGEQ